MEDAARPAVSEPPDRATGRIVRARANAGVGQCLGADPQGVVVMGPQGHLPAWGDASQIIGRWPSAPVVGGPAVAGQPGAGRQDTMGLPKHAKPGDEVRRVGQVHLGHGERGVREVKVAVGHAGQCERVGRLQRG